MGVPYSKQQISHTHHKLAEKRTINFISSNSRRAKTLYFLNKTQFNSTKPQDTASHLLMLTVITAHAQNRSRGTEGTENGKAILV